MDILILLKHLSEIVDIVFKISSLISVFSMEISITLFVFNFFFYIFLVKSYHTFLKLLEVSNMMKALEYIILELLFIAFLFL